MINILNRIGISKIFNNSHNSEYSSPAISMEYCQNNQVPSVVRTTQMKHVQYEGLKLFERKNRDYGDAFARYGPIGVLMRMGDKISRLQSITKNGVVLVNDEQMRDTLIDLHNYSAMAVMLLDEGKELTIEDATYIDENEDFQNYFYNKKYYVLVGTLISSLGVVAVRYFKNKKF